MSLGMNQTLFGLEVNLQFELMANRELDNFQMRVKEGWTLIPFTFVLARNGFTHILKTASNAGVISGLGPMLVRYCILMQYADDARLFC